MLFIKLCEFNVRRSLSTVFGPQYKLPWHHPGSRRCCCSAWCVASRWTSLTSWTTTRYPPVCARASLGSRALRGSTGTRARRGETDGTGGTLPPRRGERRGRGDSKVIRLSRRISNISVFSSICVQNHTQSIDSNRTQYNSRLSSAFLTTR